MFSLSFGLILLIGLCVHGQNDNFNKDSLFGQFQNRIENQNENFGAFSQSSSFQFGQDELTLSCFRVRPNIKNAHPTDNRKYYVCRDELNFEVFTCPNDGIFDENEKACIDLCEQKKPCLNQGQCIILANLTLGCVCRRDWTGERCEIPLSTCAKNPCGPNAECRMLKATDYSQDYVCICDNQKSYGRNCQQTVPNPCLTSQQQFHSFAYSRRAYINCDDEVIFFQPCNGFLYWHQDVKRCDRPFPLILKAPFLNLINRNSQRSQIQRNNIDSSTQFQKTNSIFQSFTNDREWQQNKPEQFTPSTFIRSNIDKPQDFSSFSQNNFNTQQSSPFQNQQFVETTTTIPTTTRIFRLQGFGDQNTQFENNVNGQISSSGNFNSQSQSWQNSQFTNEQQSPKEQTFSNELDPQTSITFNQFEFKQQRQPVQQQSFQSENDRSTGFTSQSNNQNFGFQSQSQPSQLTSSSSSFDQSNNVDENTQQGVFKSNIRGWNSNQQDSLNNIDHQKPSKPFSSFQTK